MTDCKRMELYIQLRPHLKQMIDTVNGYGKLEKTALMSQMRNDMIQYKKFVENYKEVMYEEGKDTYRSD